MQVGDMGGESGLDVPGGYVNAAGRPAMGTGGADQGDGPAAAEVVLVFTIPV